MVGPRRLLQGGQSTSGRAALDTDDPEFYETERWGHFSYAIPRFEGRYTATLYFIEHGAVPGSDILMSSATETILSNLNIVEEKPGESPARAQDPEAWSLTPKASCYWSSSQ